MSRQTPLAIRRLVRDMPESELRALTKRLEADIPWAQTLLDAARRALKRRTRRHGGIPISQQDGS